MKMSAQGSNWAWQVKDLEPFDRLVLLALGDSWSPDWPKDVEQRFSVSGLAERVHSTVEAAIERLIAAGAVEFYNLQSGAFSLAYDGGRR